jgi:IS30 family transposase
VGSVPPAHPGRLLTLAVEEPRQHAASAGELAQLVAELLAQRWSPQQISRHLRLRFPGQSAMWLCHQSIYQAVYQPGSALLRPSRLARTVAPPLRDGDTLHDALTARMADLPAAAAADHPGAGNRNGPSSHDRAIPGRADLLLRLPLALTARLERNTDELLRAYFPKGTDLSAHSPQHLLAVENELNNRPRVVLNDRAPAELFSALLASQNPSVLRR